MNLNKYLLKDVKYIDGIYSPDVAHSANILEVFFKEKSIVYGKNIEKGFMKVIIDYTADSKNILASRDAEIGLAGVYYEYRVSNRESIFNRLLSRL